MGGDRGPAEIVAGALEAREDGIEVVLLGDPGIDTRGLELWETSGVIGMHEKPSEAVRAKPQSSLVASLRAVAEGDADAVVSAGNTGALLAAGLLELPRPDVRLLSIGEEPEKGNQLTIEAHELLSAADFDFRGNCEGRDLLAGA